MCQLHPGPLVYHWLHAFDLGSIPGGPTKTIFLGLLVLMEGWSWVRVLVGRSRLVDMFRGTMGMGWGAGLVVMVVPALHFLFFTQVGDFRGCHRDFSLRGPVNPTSFLL